MTCDKCNQTTERVFNLTEMRAIEPYPFWCIPCVDGAGFLIPPAHRDMLTTDGAIRERWEALQAAKRKANFQALIESKKNEEKEQ